MKPLATKIEVVGVQLAALEKTVSDGRDEVRRWREELKADHEKAKVDFLARMDKHDEEDARHHNQALGRIDRLETQTLEGGKLVIARLEALERNAVMVDTAKQIEDRLAALEKNAVMASDAKALEIRLALLEKGKVAAEAVEAYKKWLVGTVVLTAISLMLNAARWLPNIHFGP